MSAKIFKIDKDSLAEVSNTALAISNVQSLAIQHLHDNAISDQSTLLFTINIADGHAPYINEEEFMVVIREKVDATSRGPNEITITNVGDDVGKYDYNQKVPYRPWELPQGFRELKGKNG